MRRVLNDTKILGYSITTKSIDYCIIDIIKWIEKGKEPKYFVCANPHSLEVAKTDQLFDMAIRNSDLIVPDGIGLIIASKMLGGKISNRITGTDVFLGLSEILNKKGKYSYFFLGSTSNNLEMIRRRMNDEFPNIRIAGTFSPPFKPEFTEEDSGLMIEEINRVKPDVLWVGMTAPKQEKWIYRNRENLDVKFIGAIGAVFDFFTGTVNRSHPWFQKHGLEWFPRFLKQPRRLWRRNLVSNPVFLFRVLAHRYISRNLKNE